MLPGGVVCAAAAILIAGWERPSGSALSHLSIALGRSANGGADQPDLSALFAQFQSISSLFFSASVVLDLDDPFVTRCECELIEVDCAGQPIFGQLDHWSAADRYRVSSYVEPDRFPGMQTDVAYDGRRFQLLRSDGTLSYSEHDSAILLPLVPNPLLALLTFRYPLTDENYQFELRLKDVQRDRPPPGFFDVEWVSIDEGGRTLERAEFPGGTYEGRTYVHYVYALPGHRNAPVRIERVTTDGIVMTSTEFTNYVQVDTPNGPTYWPLQVVLRALDSDGSDVVKIAYQIDTIEVDAPIPDEVLVIDPQAAARIWDDDRQEFVSP